VNKYFSVSNGYQCHLSLFLRLKIPMQSVQLYQPIILQFMIAVNQ